MTKLDQWSDDQLDAERARLVALDTGNGLTCRQAGGLAAVCAELRRRRPRPHLSVIQGGLFDNLKEAAS